MPDLKPDHDPERAASPRSSAVVTGASGFLGRAVVPRLVASFDRVIAVDLVSPHTDHGIGVIPVVSDLSDMTPLLKALGPNPGAVVLVHLAWDMNRAGGYASQAANIPVLAGLLEGLRETGLSRVVALGSAEEYGPLSGAISETARIDGPLSPYGWAKHAGWLMASSWSARQGVPLLWLRPFIIFGLGQSGPMLLPTALRAAREKIATDFSDGLQERDFVHVDDVARAIDLAATAETAGAHAVNLGHGHPVAVRHVLERIRDHFDAAEHLRLGRRPTRPGEPARQVADIARARTLLGWTPRIGLEEGLQATFLG